MQAPRALLPSSWLTACALALTLTMAPATADLERGAVTLSTAEAAKGGNGNGRGDRGGGHDEAERGGKAKGKGWGRGGVGHDTKSYGSFDSFADEMRGGKGRKAFDPARDRYERALELDRQRPGKGRGGEVGNGRKAADLSPDETRALIERGWSPKERARADGFRNHGERVSTMVELAKELGYGARVGAMQGTFGTPFETGVAGVQEDLEEARAELELAPEDPELQARVEELEDDLAAAVEGAKPGRGPDDDWATADLDVNEDGTVDRRDLDALREENDTADADGTTDGTAG